MLERSQGDNANERRPTAEPRPFSLDLPPSASVLPIETNVGQKDSPLYERDGELTTAFGPPAAPIGSHGLDGRYSMILPTLEELNLRHLCWSKRRGQVLAAASTGAFGRNRLLAFNCCGSQAMLSWHKSGQWVLCQSFTCHDRFCTPCARARSARIASNLSKKISKSGSRFVTLTLSSDATPLTKQIDRLYRSFRTLRADEWWQHNVSGGCAFLEVTHNPHTGLWHPHLHPIIQGSFLPQHVLARKWFAITGNSPIVHIKAVADGETIARYVSKYAAKCMDDSVFDDRERLQELMISQSGRRFCMTFGNWRGWKLNEHEPLDMSEFKPAGSLTRITALASQGDSFAVRTLNALRKNLRWDSLNPEADSIDNPCNLTEE